MIFLEEQLSFLHMLQEWRSPTINAFFQFLNFFDSDYYATLLIAFVWLGCSAKWGARLGFLLIADALINFTAKIILALPRPVVFDPNLPFVQTSTRFGCPSGGAEMAFVLGCALIYCWKSKWAWPVSIFYFLLIGFSRLFLGVHFPIDVLGGWLLGLCVFFTFSKVVHPIERWAGSFPKITLFVVLGMVLLLQMAFPHPTSIKFMKMGCILALGLFLGSQPGFQMRSQMQSSDPVRSPWKRALTGTLGVAGCGLFYALIQQLPFSAAVLSWLNLIVIGLWISFLGVRVLSWDLKDLFQGSKGYVSSGQ